jgi:hypothetical protein
MIGLGIGLTQLSILARGRVVNIAQFQDWFLASGVWDENGRWFDQALWEAEWFLETGRINVFGVWDDAEVWT